MSVNKELRAGTTEHKNVLAALLARKRISTDFIDKKKPVWDRADRECSFTIPEKDADRLRKAQRDTGTPQYTTVQVPYAYAQMLTAHTYFASVLLGRSPVWQFMGLHGEGEMNIKAVEALMDYQLVQGAQLPPLYVWLMDGVKYGIGVVMDHWDKEIGYVSSMVESPVVIGDEVLEGHTRMMKRTEAIEGYEGNRLVNVRPHNFLPDPRVGVNRLQEGEFAGRKVRIGWNAYLKGVQEGKYFNREWVEKHLKVVGNTGLVAQFFAPDQQDDEYTIASVGQHEKSSLVSQMPGFEMVVELIPNEWGLGSTEYPEKWVFTVLDDKVIIQARPQGCYHNKFPFGVLEVEIEGYELFRRGMLETGRPLNEILDWLINTHFYAVRKDLNGSIVYDPSRVVAADLLGNTPGNRIRLQPSAYGTDPRMAIHALTAGPSLTGTHLRDSDIVMTMMQRVLGVSESGMGALPGSSRRTATEVRSSSAGSIGRMKTITEYIGATSFTPLATRLVQNSQQYYKDEKKFLIAGDQVANPGGFVDVTPNMIAGAYQYAPIDGSLPADRFAQVTMWTQLLGQMKQFPQLLGEYRLSDLFAWVAQLAGLKNIKQFRIQALPPGALPDPNGVSGNVGSQFGASGAQGYSGGNGTGAPVIPLAPQTPGVGRAL